MDHAEVLDEEQEEEVLSNPSVDPKLHMYTSFLDLQASQAEPSNDSGVMVQELSVSSHNHWPNLARLGGDLPIAMESRDEAWGLFLPQIGARRPPQAKMVKPSSGFPQFSKGKAVVKRKMNKIAENPLRNALFAGGRGGTDEGVSIREWLMKKKQRFNKAERLNLFRQIVELVDISHSQGLALHNLKPSYFLILAMNQVKYVGSLVPEGQVRQQGGLEDNDLRNSENNLKRKMPMQMEMEDQFSPKQRKIGSSFASRAGLGGGLMKENDHGIVRSDNLSPISKAEIRMLEERWYASPEEMNDNICYLSSNIYNLGVLVFELFCGSETWQAHCVAMSNLRHRILPPKFLSESPKETSLCLWLLHPDASSRPKSRDILTCGLVCEGRDISSLEQSSASIDQKDAEADLLLHFLLTSKDQKEKRASKLIADLGSVQADIKEAEKRHSLRTKTVSSARGLLTKSNGNPDLCLQRGTFDETTISKSSISSTSKDRLMRNFDQLENSYFSTMSEIELPETSAAARSDRDILNIRNRYFQGQYNDNSIKEPKDRLDTFIHGLSQYARYSRFEECGSLRNVDSLNSTNVICSLSFDRDEDYFAAAGVSKKIKIFEFSSLLNDSVDIHYPLIEMSSRSMLSCVCWNNYIKNFLGSASYDGGIQLWDASTGQGVTNYREHQKRAWSVDFSQTDPMKLASGSDDSLVKLWSINEKNSIGTIRNMANVCCVKFSPYSSHLLAFGTADYKVYCYDLRNTRIPWCELSGHEKAVSYVKFVDSATLVSASTDNTLKQWDLNKTNTEGYSTDGCRLTYRGHTNKKNFVGLSVSDGYIACGSETNEVYAYYKTFPMPITAYKFGSADPITGQETADDNGQSVSSVCWRAKSNMLVAATSGGSIKLLKLV